MTPAAETAAAVATATATAAAASATPTAAAASATPAAKPGPVVQYKQADAKKIAGAVAKEVGKTLAPIILLVVVVIGVVIYLLVR